VLEGEEGEFRKLYNKTNFERIWHGYNKFKDAIIRATPDVPKLRDKDRYLWSKSQYTQLEKDIQKCFQRQ